MSGLYATICTEVLFELYLLNYSDLFTDACSTTCSTTGLLLAKLLFAPPLLLLAVSEGEDGVKGEMRERGGGERPWFGLLVPLYRKAQGDKKTRRYKWLGDRETRGHGEKGGCDV